ncbi:hypothetical protein OC835_004770 [Tilletia horrida]|nr:hypothetical protein OC835_004770 [Tilletia horrida]
MERILGGGAGRHWLRLGVRTAAMRTVGSSMASSSRAAAAAAATAAEPSALAHRAPALSVKAQGKQKECSYAAAAAGLASPYFDDGRSSSACSSSSFVADIALLQQQLADSILGDEQENAQRKRRRSAQAWLAVLDAHSASSYSTAAPYLLSTGAFYCSPLENRPGGRALLARLHCHLLASQIHSSADAELALKVLQRLCALGSKRPHSSDAWPPCLSPASDSSASSSAGPHFTAAQQQRLSTTFSRHTGLAVAAVTIVLERIMRDLGATHLVFDCMRLVTRLALRFRGQLSYVRAKESLHRMTRSYAAVHAQHSRWAVRVPPNSTRKAAHKKTATFHALFLHLAHLLPHHSDIRHTYAAVHLLNLVVTLCRVRLKRNLIDNSRFWPSFYFTPTLNKAKVHTSYTSRWSSSRAPALFTPDLCRDVARALLDAPCADEHHSGLALLEPWCETKRWLPAMSTRPRHLQQLDDEGTSIEQTNLGLRSGKRGSFLSGRSARACILAIIASTLQRRRHWSDRYGERTLAAGDYGHALRAIAYMSDSISKSKRQYVVDWLAGAALRKERHSQSAKEVVEQQENALKRLSYRRSVTLRVRCYQSFRYSETTLNRTRQSRLFEAREAIWLSTSNFFKQSCNPWPQLRASPSGPTPPDELKGDDMITPRVKYARAEMWSHIVALLASDPDVPAEKTLDLLSIPHGMPSCIKNEDDPRWQVWTAKLQIDPSAYRSAIYGFGAQRRFNAVDLVWTAALERAMHLQGPFHNITRAYLRTKRNQVIAGQKAYRRHLLQQVFETAAMQLCDMRQAYGRNASNNDSLVPSTKLVSELIKHLSSTLGQPRAAFALWTSMFDRIFPTATTPRVLSSCLAAAADAETASYRSGSGASTVSLGMEARRIFRRLLFRQHPSLADAQASTLPQQQLAEADAEEWSLGASLSLSFSAAPCKLSERVPYAVLAQSNSASFDSVQSWTRAFCSSAPQMAEVAGPGDARMPYINFDHRVFEAYCTMLHLMMVPDSIIRRSSAPRLAAWREIDADTQWRTCRSWVAALFGPEEAGRRMKEGRSWADKAEDEPDVATPPKRLTSDEIITVLKWMRALHVRPTMSMLCLISVHLAEMRPASARTTRNPLGRHARWLAPWLGADNLPTVDDVATWLREQRREMDFVQMWDP